MIGRHVCVEHIDDLLLIGSLSSDYIEFLTKTEISPQSECLLLICDLSFL